MIEKAYTLLLFGVIGLGIEVIFTALYDLLISKKSNRVHLFGYSSLWYLPLYGVVLPLGIYFLNSSVGNLPLLLRGVIYAILIQIGEFLVMWLLHVINGQSPSEKEYLNSKHSIKGFTRWDYFPAFILLGLIFEYLVRHWLV